MVLRHLIILWNVVVKKHCVARRRQNVNGEKQYVEPKKKNGDARRKSNVEKKKYGGMQ